MKEDHFSSDNFAIIEQNNNYKNKPTIGPTKKMKIKDNGNTIRTLTDIHHGGEFITKKQFNEIPNKNCRAIRLRIQYTDESPNKQATLKALGGNLAVQQYGALEENKQFNPTTTKSKV